MLNRLLLGDAVDGRKALVGNVAAVGPQGPQFGQIASQEYLQLAAPYEKRAVRDYTLKETLIALIATELGPAVLTAGDIHGSQPLLFLPCPQRRKEAELPPALDHSGRHPHVEAQSHRSVPFRHVAEAGRHHYRRNDVACHHLPVFVAHGAHQQHGPPLCIRNLNGIGHGVRSKQVRGREIFGHAQAGSYGPVPHRLHLACRGAGAKNQKYRRNPDSHG